MKILPVEMIREADAYTIKNEPVSDIDLMERAASACFYWMIANIPADRKILVFAGTGNNGGDGLAIARMMIQKGYAVHVFLSGKEEHRSPSCRTNLERLDPLLEMSITQLTEKEELPPVNPDKDVIVDALFGSGLSRPVEGFNANIIRHLNSSGAFILSVDIPSGLFCDETVSGLSNPAIIHADQTLTFSPPKYAFFFPENDKYTGNWELLDIGLMREFTENAQSRNVFVEKSDVAAFLKTRNKFSHKGIFGHALLICGSTGKMGAAVLSANACLRTGTGLVSVHVPSGEKNILQTAVPEAMLDIDASENLFSGIKSTENFTAIGIGPGIGMNEETQNALKLLIQNSIVPLVFDADALNILGENKTWISFIPKGSIFTPHKKEFERIAGFCSNDFERNERQRELSIKYGIYILLKGAYTAITTPEGNCYFNPTGNPGMATGGSGDVLTGIITGLRAQGYSPLEACLLGAYLHGLAGDIAAEESGEEAMIAGDIVRNLGKAFKGIREFRNAGMQEL